MMTLLLQLNGDLPERFRGHERKLYIFACKSKTCKKKTGSIRAIRGTKISQDTSSRQVEAPGPSQPSPPKLPPMLGDTIFGSKQSSTASSNANPFSTSQASDAIANPLPTTPFSASNPFSDLSSKPPQQPGDLPMTFAQKAQISSPRPLAAALTPKAIPHEPWPSQSGLPPPYPSYHLDADYETLDVTPAPQPASSSCNIAIDEDTGGGGGGGVGKDQAYESAHDAIFERFASRLSHNPLQVLRYEFGGSPLLYSKIDQVGQVFTSGQGAKIPRCDRCGQKRVFEVQLVPHAIAELEVDEVGFEGMEWGTVILGVCTGDCGDGGRNWGWKEEWVGVQWEESGVRR